MPLRNLILAAALLFLLPAGLTAQTCPATCTPNTGYPWPQCGCLNAADLNNAFAGRLPMTGGALTGTTSAPFLQSGSVPYVDWLATYAYGTNGTNLVGLSTSGQGAITGASRTSTSVGGSAAAIGDIGFAFADASGTLANMPAWGFYGECRNYPSNTGYCHGEELDATNLSGTTVQALPYSWGAPGSTGALALAGGGACVAGTPCYNPATGLTNLTATTASYGQLIANNGAPFKVGILFGQSAIAGDDGTDTANGGIAIALGRGQAINWYRTGDVETFSIASNSTAAGPIGKLIWDNQGLEIQQGSGAGSNLFNFNPSLGTAVNGLAFVSANTGSSPAVQSIGSDTNVGIVIQPKGSGAIDLGGQIQSSGIAGVSCTGPPTANFATTNGIVTRC